MTAGAVRQSCLACGRGWQHCHGTVILHAGGEQECTTQDPGCVAAVEVHDMAVPCDQLLDGCGCQAAAGVAGT